MRQPEDERWWENTKRETGKRPGSLRRSKTKDHRRQRHLYACTATATALVSSSRCNSIISSSSASLGMPHHDLVLRHRRLRCLSSLITSVAPQVSLLLSLYHPLLMTKLCPCVRTRATCIIRHHETHTTKRFLKQASSQAFMCRSLFDAETESESGMRVCGQR